VVVVTNSGFFPMVSTHRKSAPQDGSNRVSPSSRVTRRSRPGLTAPNLSPPPAILHLTLWPTVASRSTERGFCPFTIVLDAPNPHSCRDGRTGCCRHRRRDQPSDAGGPGR